jgi:hypothetical protein
MTDEKKKPALAAWAFRPVDAAFLGAFRILFGVMMLYGVVRFAANGWIDEFFLQSKFHFKYWGFEWVRAWPAWGMYLHFAVMGLSALGVALGLFYRVAIVTFFLTFTYVELIDVTLYLNHYYLVSLLALLLVFLPAHRVWSLDARRRPALRQATVPAFQLYLLRAQVGTVYFFAGLAKFQSDWLLHAQPLNIWLNSRTDFPLIGQFFAEPWTAYALSWAGFLFDTTIAFWLLWGRTRIYAYLVVIGFHVMTRALFPIGMFPVIMILSALVFFPPEWPRALARRLSRYLPALGRLASKAVAAEPPPASVRLRAALVLCCAYAVLQILIPLRHHVYGGNVLWHEQGMRYAWKVMVRAKGGSVTYLVRSEKTGRTYYISPRRYLRSYQEREMSAQPDLILQLARHIADDFRANGHGDVEVRADVPASLNGRPTARLIDPEVDLARVSDGIAKAPWIQPEPSSSPPELRPRPPAAPAVVAAGSAGR